ncbi:MAG TPA: hypothetical protein PKG77_21560, partial [Phycisphaerae bacterium]|nr:hypothetical protein [Phycisphaerae bacterium]
MRSRLGWFIVLSGAILPGAVLGRDAAGLIPPSVTIVSDANPPSPVQHGLAKLTEALKRAGVAVERAEALGSARGKTLVVAGLAGNDGPAASLLTSAGQAAPQGPEALVIHNMRWREKPAWVVVGSDARGLMYALLDVADRVGWAEDPLDPLGHLQPARERPDCAQRAVSLYTMNRAYWESRFHDQRYWTRYLDMLAGNRFNSLVIVFGYENGGFLAPCYPYFFDVDGFPDVNMVGITPQQQRRNLEALNGLIRMAHERGLDVTVGIWDHIYRGGVQGGGIAGSREVPGKPTENLVWGVNARNLTAYTTAALAEFLRRVKQVDGIQFRMHDESGLKKSEQEAFWRAVFQIMKERAPHVRFDARAKGLPDAVIQAGLDSGVRLRITTKYWMEQMGMPFHPTHINRQNQHDRRHSYADLLRYPRRYPIHWRLWNGGTTRVLLWGDPEFARRFAASTHLYDGDGFEVNEPLATKMEAQPHGAKPFELLKPEFRYYDYEFERYWHFFQVFGRMGYNPQTPEEVWRREFARRFGARAGAHLEEALHRASWILPRIVAACYPYRCFPTTRGWAEKQRLGGLPAYAQAEGSDVQQFASFDEEAVTLLEGRQTAKTRPQQTSLWLARTAQDVLARLAQARDAAGGEPNKEHRSTATDLAILANLALFHSRRIPAAVNYRLFERTGDPGALESALGHERGAVEAWRTLVAAAGDVYADDLQMGVRSADLCGHWRDELGALEKGLGDLERKLADLKAGKGRPPGRRGTAPAPKYPVRPASADQDAPTVVHEPVLSAPAGKPLAIEAQVRDSSGVAWVRLRYRAVNQQLDYQTLEMI